MTDAEQAAEFRKKSFAIKIEKLTPEPFAESELALRVTTNGSQWQTIGLTEDEADMLVIWLQQYLCTPNRPDLEGRLL